MTGDPMLTGLDQRPQPPRHRRGLYVLVALVALTVYVPGVWWGVPHATAPDRVRPWPTDDETPLGPLSEVSSIRSPRENRNLGYPLMFSFMVTAAYSPYLVYLYATDRFSEPSAEYPFGLDDPVTAIRDMGIIAHLVSALMAVALVLGVFDAGRVAAGRRAGLLSAALAGLAFPMVYYARTGNVDMSMLAFAALAFAACTRCIVRGVTLRRAMAFGAAAGFALATKEAVLGALIAMPFALLWVRSREMRGQGGLRTWKAWAPLLGGLGVSVIALGLGSGLFVDPERYFAHIAFLGGRIDELAQGSDIAGVTTYPYSLSGNIDYAVHLLKDLSSVLTWPGLLLAIAGSVWCTMKHRRIALVIMPGAAYLLYIFVTLRVAQLRYVLPCALFFALPVAVLARDAWQRGRRSVRLATVLAMLAVLSLNGLRAFDLTAQMLTDSRYAAGEWLAGRLQAGDRVEYFGASQKLPALPAGVAAVRAAEYRGMYVAADHSDSTVAAVLAGWDDRNPDFVILIPDHTSEPGDYDGHTVPPALIDSLENGSQWREAAFFRSRRPFAWLPLPRLDYPTVNPPVRIYQRRTPGT